MTTKPRVCLIGAGPAGISALCQWSHLATEGVKVPDVVCYDKQKMIGGQWNFIWRIGTDENGEPVHSSVYRHMVTNTPKEIMESSDYTFDQHFGRDIPSYPSAALMKDYLYGRLVSKPGNLLQYIQFNTAVKWVSYDDATDLFTVTVRNYDTDTVTSSTFSHVIVSTGIRCTPNYTTYPGFESFPGRILHAHDFKDGTQYRGQRVLVIGAKYTADDFALHLPKYGAEHVIISHRSKPILATFPAIVEERPEVKRVNNKTVHFIDGSQAEVDTIIFATGYMYDFPFLDDDLRIDQNTHVTWYPELYKLTLWHKGGNNKLFYTSTGDNLFSFNVYDCQAAWIWKVILGVIALPGKEAMFADVALWLDKLQQLEPIDDLKPVARFQMAFMDDLCHQSGYDLVNVKETLDVAEAFINARSNHMPSYKDQAYTSVHSGGKALKVPKPWLEDIDDEFEELCNKFIKYKDTTC